MQFSNNIFLLQETAPADCSPWSWFRLIVCLFRPAAKMDLVKNEKVTGKEYGVF